MLLAVFGISASVTIPFIFAACTITGTLGIVYGIAHLAETPTYVTNLVQLIGLGIAVDYSLLIVYRFREELANGLDKDDAVVRTMETAGRSVVFSGIAVALGLALLVAMPLPFMRMMGVAGFLIPLVSILAAVTLQPVLLSLYGRRGVAAQADPARRADSTPSRASGRGSRAGSWRGRCSSSPPGRRARRGGAAGVRPPADAGLDLRHPAHAAVGAGLRRAPARGRAGRRRAGDRARDRATGTVRDPEVEAAVGRLVAALKRDPEVAAVAAPTGRPLRRPDAAATGRSRRRPPRLRLPRGAGVRPPAARAR